MNMDEVRSFYEVKNEGKIMIQIYILQKEFETMYENESQRGHLLMSAE